MTLSEIIQNRPHTTDELFLGEILIKDKYGYMIKSESFKSRNERKILQEKLTTLYQDKIQNREWTISILWQ